MIKRDTGCDDLDRAAYNRYIIANHLFCEAYYFVESSLAHTPSGQPLPKGIPIGNLPVVGRKEIRRASGEWGRYWVEDETPITIPLVGEEDLTEPPGEVV